jgi:uncharacterized protein
VRRVEETAMAARRPRLALVPLLALLLLIGPALAAGEIVVGATGIAYGTPDLAVIELGHQTSDPDVGTALARADAAIRAVRNALDELGVDPLDVRTTSYTVWREEHWTDRGQPAEPVFRVTHLLEVVVRDVERVGAVIVATTAAGANQIGGLSYTAQDPRALEERARRLAFEAAHAKARQLADLAGAALGPALHIVEAAGAPLVPVAERAAMAFADAAAPVTGGRLAVEVRLEIRFALER